MIYTRSNERPRRTGSRYEPPPGYDGNAFSQDVKLHEGDEDVTTLRRPREVAPVAQTSQTTSVAPASEEVQVEGVGSGEVAEGGRKATFEEGLLAFEEVFRQLRGRFGREELILVLVMLLISSGDSSNGAGVELLLLSLLLISN